MADGREEREEFQKRMEQEKREPREYPTETDERYDWEPERADS